MASNISSRTGKPRWIALAVLVASIVALASSNSGSPSAIAYRINASSLMATGGDATRAVEVGNEREW